MRQSVDPGLRISALVRVDFPYAVVQVIDLFNNAGRCNLLFYGGPATLRRREEEMAEDRWRQPAAYLYVLNIPRSCRAWEFLRRSAGYRDDHRTAVSSAPAAIKPSAPDLRAAEGSPRWGLQFLARSRPQR